MIFLGTAIILFEIAYRKEKGNLAIYGIESLVVAIFTLFLPYIIFELNETQRKYYFMVSIYVAIYYILKSVYVSAKIKSKYMNSISDVKEIVKKEKHKRIIQEDIDDEENQPIIENINTNDSNKQQKKRGRPKKTETKNSKSKSKETGTKNSKSKSKETETKNSKSKSKETKTKNSKSKPKETETKNNENKLKESETPKKRGRPRKVVADIK